MIIFLLCTFTKNDLVEARGFEPNDEQSQSLSCYHYIKLQYVPVVLPLHHRTE